MLLFNVILLVIANERHKWKNEFDYLKRRNILLFSLFFAVAMYVQQETPRESTEVLLERLREFSKLLVIKSTLKNSFPDFCGDPVIKNVPANSGDMGLIPGLGRFHMPQWELMRNFSTCTLRLEKSLSSNEDSAQPKNKKNLKKNSVNSPQINVHVLLSCNQKYKKIFIENKVIPKLNWKCKHLTISNPWEYGNLIIKFRKYLF